MTNVRARAEPGFCGSVRDEFLNKVHSEPCESRLPIFEGTVCKFITSTPLYISDGVVLPTNLRLSERSIGQEREQKKSNGGAQTMHHVFPSDFLG